jgi:drug/metabolite transporter (DMT)-like permease
MRISAKEILSRVLKTVVFIVMVIGIPIGVWLFLEPITFWQKFALMIVDAIITLIMYELYILFQIEDIIDDIVY